MTPERFEELVIKAWKQNAEDATIAETRAALTAVYPLIRNEVIDECDAELVLSNNKGGARAKIRALKSKETKL